jgi:hypothetical protein
VKARLSLFALLVSARAAGAACERGELPEPGVPARVAPGPAGLGSIPEACAATELALRADAALLVASDDFYGGIQARGVVRARYALSSSVWLSAWLPGPDYRYVANATLTADSFDVGASALGIHVGLPLAAKARLAPFARVLVPTETVFQNATRWGFDQGLSFAGQLTSRIELLGGLSFPFLLTDGSGSVHAVFEPLLDLEASFSAFRKASALVGFAVRVRGGDQAGFESFDPKLALRWLPFEKFRTELSAGFPLWGDDRTDAVLALELGWVIDGDGS